MDEIEKASKDLESAKSWAADTANLLVAGWKDGGRRSSREGVVVSVGDFEELVEAVEKWQAASQAFVDAVNKRGQFRSRLAAALERRAEKARSQGWKPAWEGGRYDYSREDLMAVVEEMGRKPTREEWASVGLTWAGLSPSWQGDDRG